MCSPVRCSTCNKTTWAGCGEHIAAVKASVPVDQWCDGTHSVGQVPAARTANPGFLARLFGR